LTAAAEPSAIRLNPGPNPPRSTCSPPVWGRRFRLAPELVWQELGHLKAREVAEVLETEPSDDAHDAEDQLAASAVSGKAPPAGPQWAARPAAPR
jgi:hypothetical protein